MSAEPVEQWAQLPRVVMSSRDISNTAKLLYAALAMHKDMGKGIFPGQDRLAELIGGSRTAVVRATRELTTHRFVSVKRRGQGRTNEYVLHATWTEFGSSLDWIDFSWADFGPSEKPESAQQDEPPAARELEEVDVEDVYVEEAPSSAKKSKTAEEALEGARLARAALLAASKQKKIRKDEPVAKSRPKPKQQPISQT